MSNVAICFWIMGEVDRAIDLISRAEAQARSHSHVATRAMGICSARSFI
jgi:hypothetical protein